MTFSQFSPPVRKVAKAVQGLDVGMIFLFPCRMVRTRVTCIEIDLAADWLLDAGPEVYSQPRIAFALTRQNEHQCPVDLTEAPLKGFFIRLARERRTPGMRVNPDSRELFWLAAGIDLFVKEVRNRLVVKLDVRAGARLADQSYIFNLQQVFGASDAECANLRGTKITQVAKLAPRVGRELNSRLPTGDARRKRAVGFLLPRRPLLR